MSMRMYGFAVAAAALLGVQGVQAQPMTGCPPGQAMQSSSPSGKTVTCVPIPDVGVLTNMIADVNARIDALTEADIVGRWSVSGPTTCLQSSNGFNANQGPLLPVLPGSTAVSQLVANSIGTRTFVAGGTGTSSGTTMAMTFPGMFFGIIQPPVGPPTTFAGINTVNIGGAAVTTFAGGFTWSIQPDGTLLIDDDNTIPQAFLSPPNRVGWTVTITNFPSYVGYISKDKRTITLVHAIKADGSMQVETSTARDANGVLLTPIPRICNRYRVLTRLPD